MQAAVTRGKHQIEIERLPVPEPGPGEVRVRVRACGVCGTDLHLFGSGFFAPGTTPGHEMMGEVAASCADELITVGGDAKFIAEKAEEEGMDEKNIHKFLYT